MILAWFGDTTIFDRTCSTSRTLLLQCVSKRPKRWFARLRSTHLTTCRPGNFARQVGAFHNNSNRNNSRKELFPKWRKTFQNFYLKWSRNCCLHHCRDYHLHHSPARSSFRFISFHFVPFRFISFVSIRLDCANSSWRCNSINIKKSISDNRYHIIDINCRFSNGAVQTISDQSDQVARQQTNIFK